MFTFISAPFRALHFLPVAAVAALAVAPAEGAIILKIDAEAKTFTWTGSVTSAVITAPDSTAVSVRLAINASSSPTISAGEATGALAATGNYVPGSNAFVLPGFGGTPMVGIGLDTLYTNVAVVFSPETGPNGPGTSTATVTLEGNDLNYSYAGLPLPHQIYLESLDGQDLFFHFNPGGVYQSVGPSAGSVTVVPEPSAVMLLGAVVPLVWLRRKRTGV